MHGIPQPVQPEAAIGETIVALHQRGLSPARILDRLAELGVPAGTVSPREVRRLVAQHRRVVETVRRSRLLAGALAAGLEGEDAAARLNIELLHAVLTELMIPEEGEAPALSPDALHVLAKSLGLLAKARRDDAEATLRLGAAAERAARERAAGSAERAALARGLSAETVAAIKAEILGVEAVP